MGKLKGLEIEGVLEIGAGELARAVLQLCDVGKEEEEEKEGEENEGAACVPARRVSRPLPMGGG